VSYDISLSIVDAFDRPHTVYDDNITFNVTPMWNAAGLTMIDANDDWAHNLTAKLVHTIEVMLREPEDYIVLEPENGWGDYRGAMDFLVRLLIACLRFPQAVVTVDR